MALSDEDDEMSTTFVKASMALLVVACIFAAVCGILRARSLVVRFSTCIFVLSLFSTQLLMKVLGSAPFSFRFPALVTSLHFLSMWLLSVVYWVWVGDRAKLSPASLGSAAQYFTIFGPIALTLPLSVVFNNQALLYIGAGLNGIIATLAPITTAMLQHKFGRQIAARGWIGVVVAGFGALMIGWGEFQEKQRSTSLLQGCVFSGLAVLLRSCKVVLVDQLLAPSAYSNPHKALSQAPAAPALVPMQVWALQAPLCFLVTLACMMLGKEDVSKAWREATAVNAGMVALTCVSASVLNVLGVLTIKELGASSMQIIGKLNTIVIVAFSVAFLGEELPVPVVFGTLVVLVGIAIFENSQTKVPHPGQGDSTPGAIIGACAPAE